ncbi:NDR1/HIN1-like protein [Thalictrum thalictroides]|uniref:NDR1/HIN1-like protein n=1 Tax=Thalictrum thalictroides TaxID=46969 RepID=A0A7J6WYC2_THATH|nr:NDR1/HIN1-like protein [Thalictrum thalictroides]
MEERVSPPPPLKPKPNDEEPSLVNGPPSAPPPPPYPPTNSQGENANNESRIVTFKDRQMGTFVVQVPKVQIYRVPPPENAMFMERFRTPEQQKRPCSIFVTKCFLFSVILVLILGVCAALIYLTIRPKYPTFSIEDVLVKTIRSKHQQQHVEYHITLNSNNPNDRMNIIYDKGGSISLSFKKHEIAKGNTPALQQDSHEDKDLVLVLPGSKAKLPSEINKSLSGQEKKKTKLALSLSVKIPVKMEIWIVKLWSMDIAIECDLEVNTLSKDTRVLHQKCDAKDV